MTHYGSGRTVFCPGMESVKPDRKGSLAIARSLGGQIAITTGANGGLAALGFVSGVLAARILGPRGRGELAAIQISATVLATIATLGLPEAVTLYCARDPERAGRHLGSALVLGLIACAPMLLLGYSAMPYLLRAQSHDVITAARWYLLVAVFFVLIGSPHAALRGISDFAAWNALRFAPLVIWISVLLLAWMVGRATPEFVASLNLVLLGTILTPLTFFVVSCRIRNPFHPDLSSWSPMLRFGLPSVASGLPTNLNLRLDQMLMAALLPASSLGLYVVAVAWSGAVSPLLQALGAVTFPHVASHASLGEQSRAFVRIVRLASPVALFLAVGIALITPWSLPRVFGYQFRESIPSALVLIAAGSVLSLNQLLEEGFRGMGNPMCILWSELAGLVVTVISLACLLKPLGIFGAAISSLLGYTGVCGFLLLQAKWLTGFGVKRIVIPTISEISQGWERIRSFVGYAP